MSNAPIVTFRERFSPNPTISALNYTQSALGGNNLPLPGTEISNLIYFRVYNNFNNSPGIATMQNVQITIFDGIGAGSHTGTQSPCAQSWIRIYENGFGESVAYSNYIGENTAVGQAGADYYAPEVGSNGSATSQIRAGVDTNGVGFIEFATYAELPDIVGFAKYTIAISIIYDWTP